MKQDATVNIVEKHTARVERLEPFTDLIGETDLTNLREQISDLQRNAANASKGNRVLSIGVVGQIKRGKSSFLNALLFDGEDVLPKAASPMTAALTRIKYGEKLKAEIEFYTVDEWRQVEATATRGAEKERQRQDMQTDGEQKGGFLSGKPSTKSRAIPSKPTPDEQACMELVAMAKQGKLDVETHLGKTEVLNNVSKLTELNLVLADYVGAAGHFTPIVKSSSLTLNLPALRNIEVIDTPGINDPIVSRSRVTQQFMGRCDVIFFLSYCGQFLDQADMGLLAQTIPAKGIDDICLIGSLFDSVLLDEGHKYTSLAQATQTIATKLNQRAEKDFEQCCLQIEQAGEQAYMAKALKKALPPLFISALAFNLARHWEQPNEIERKVLQSLQDKFPNDKLDESTMRELANLKIVQQRVDQVRLHKDEILNGRLRKLQERFEPAFHATIKQLQVRLHTEKTALESGRSEELSARLNAAASRLNKGQSAVTQVFETHANNSKKILTKLNLEIKSAALDAKKVSSSTGTETKEEAYTIDKGMGFLFWRSLTGNRYETAYRNITVNYTYANVHVAIDQVEQLILEAEKRLLVEIGESINIDKLRADILHAVRGMIDFEDDAFDPDDILKPVESAVSRLSVPEINLDCSACLTDVTKRFNTTEVRDADIAALQRSIAGAVSKSLETINATVAKTQKKICADLNQTGTLFIASITSDLTAQIERLQKSQQNLQQTLVRYQKALEIVEADQ